MSMSSLGSFNLYEESTPSTNLKNNMFGTKVLFTTKTIKHDLECLMCDGIVL